MKRARLGFIGAGWWACSNHMPVLAARDDVEMVGVCRLGRDELAQVRQQFGFAFATEDFHELLDSCELDAVVVSSPHTLHFEHAQAALSAGLHVMCEKPFTIRADHARELVAIAEEHRRHLLVPYGWHYKPFVQEAKRLMNEGAVGEIEHVLCHMASPTREMLSGKALEFPDVVFNPEPATWADPKVAGGGYGHAQISHSAGMMFWLTGLRAQDVFAMMTAPGAQVDLFDAITLRFDNGALGAVSGAGSVPSDQLFQVDIRIFGTEGMLLVDCERARTHLRRHDGKHVSHDPDPNAGAYECTGPPNNFVDLVLGKAETNFAPGEAAARSVEMLDAAYRSAKSGVLERV